MDPNDDGSAQDRPETILARNHGPRGGRGDPAWNAGNLGQERSRKGRSEHAKRSPQNPSATTRPAGGSSPGAPTFRYWGRGPGRGAASRGPDFATARGPFSGRPDRDLAGRRAPRPPPGPAGRAEATDPEPTGRAVDRARPRSLPPPAEPPQPPSRAPRPKWGNTVSLFTTETKVLLG